MAFKILAVDEKKLQGYIEDGVLDDGVFPGPRGKDDVVKSFKRHLGVNAISIPKIWVYLINKYWQSVDDGFEPREVLLLKEILKNEGVLSRAQVLSLFNNNKYASKEAIGSLEEEGIIDTIILSNNEKLIILHPKFKEEVFAEDA